MKTKKISKRAIVVPLSLVMLLTTECQNGEVKNNMREQVFNDDGKVIIKDTENPCDQLYYQQVSVAANEATYESILKAMVEAVNGHSAYYSYSCYDLKKKGIEKLLLEIKLTENQARIIFDNNMNVIRTSFQGNIVECILLGNMPHIISEYGIALNNQKLYLVSKVQCNNSSTIFKMKELKKNDKPILFSLLHEGGFWFLQERQIQNIKS